MLRRFNQLGDTIIEVMVVLAVLGLAVSISYATANRSLLNERQAQESAEVTQLAQSQVENLFSYVSANGLPSSKTVSQFCFDPTFDPNPGSNNCNFGTIPYHIVVSNCNYSPTPANCPSPALMNDTFVVHGTWPDVLGDPNPDSVTLAYRVHPLP